MPDLETLEYLFTGPFGFLVAALWGAVWGSFFNVIIIRVPDGESVVRPASHCRSCKTPIAWYDNLPILSFLVLRGRCRHCGTTFSARYFFVELILCLLTVLLHYMLVVRAEGPIGLRLAQLVIASLFSGLLLCISMIDLGSLLIPTVLLNPFIPLAVLLSPLMGLPHLWDGLVGALAGYLLIHGIIAGYRLLTGIQQGMGSGDAKLLAIIGGLLGWQMLLPVLFLASLQGSVVGITLLAWGRRSTGDAPDPAAATDVKDAPPEAEAGAPPPAEPESLPVGSLPAGTDADADTDAEADDETVEAYSFGEEARRSGLRRARIPFFPFLGLAAVQMLMLRDLAARWLLLPF